MKPRSLRRRDAYVLRHMDLVEPIARRLCASLGLPASCEIPDLVQEGMLGLLEAAETYNAKRGAAPRSWAFVKISFAIRDAIRTWCEHRHLDLESIERWAATPEPEERAAQPPEWYAAALAALTPLERAVIDAIYEHNETLYSLRKSRALGIGWRVLHKSHRNALGKLRRVVDQAA